MNAPKGSCDATYLLKLPDDLLQRVREAALLEGVSLAEWWRRAGEAKLARDKRAVESAR